MGIVNSTPPRTQPPVSTPQGERAIAGSLTVPMGSEEGPPPRIIQPKCPAPFVSVDALSCVMPCPMDKKFEREGASGSYKCVYWPDKQFSVNLNTVGAAIFEGTWLEQLRNQDVSKYTEFTTEKDRVEQALAVVYENIDKQQKINDAFRDLQAAENARDKSPEAYQVARTAYYTLLKGETWIQDERKRIANAEVEPELQKYKTTLSNIDVQNREQQKTIDIVQGVKDKVLSLKDDFKYSVDTLSDQVEKVKMQINLDYRQKDKEKNPFWAWLDTILNIVLVSALLYVGYILYRKYYPKIAGEQPSTYTIQT